MKKWFSVRFVLTIGLLLSIVFAGYSMWYKMAAWGFGLTPGLSTDVWTIESRISFKPTGDAIKVVIGRPSSGKEFKILDESVIAKGYDVQKTDTQFVMTAPAQSKTQDVYYRVLLYDNVEGRGKIEAPQPPKPTVPSFDDQSLVFAKQILTVATEQPGDEAQQLIQLMNQDPPHEAVVAFLPERQSPKEMAQTLVDLLALNAVPARVVRGIKLEENKKTFTPDVMLEAYTKGKWTVYNIETGDKGLPEDFVIFQRDGRTLVDVIGGTDSTYRFSVMKSVNSSFGMARHRAKVAETEGLFNASIYNLPIGQQNILKWLMVFPLAILMVVLMRNVVGIKTMGTFTPMLIAMAMVETGFLPGLICFTIIVGVGFLIRLLLSRLNLLLVPRIASVVIFVILMMQVFAVIGYQMDWRVASSALFFPIIIMAWVIERASITCEEEGFKSAAKEVFYSVLVAIVTYFVIVNDTIRHIMFAFNELNLVILFVVMLLGTYTGYRLTELKRFASLAKGKK